MTAVNDPGLRGKSIIVTGGSRGIGRAIVELLAGEGAEITFFYRKDDAAADEVVNAGRATGKAMVADRVDVTDPEACVAAAARVVERNGRVDILVNNAGVVRDGILGMLESEDVRTVLDTNVAGVFNMTRAVLPYMISERSGKIINMSSVSGDKGGRGQTNYAASKGAINAFTKALAVEVARRRITVNAVAPGMIDTDMSRDVMDRSRDEVLSRILLRRLGTPEEVARAVWFLASDYANYITGHVLAVDGGFKME